jgi:putative hydrolase of the HAD superfamily
MIRAVILDLDGVVLEKSCFSERLAACFGILPKTTAAFFKSGFQNCQRGEADLKVEISSFLPAWGWQGSVESFLDFWFKCDSVVQAPVMNSIPSLRDHGFSCYLATNQEMYRTEFLRQNLDLEAYFDGAFYSAELGFRKPGEDFFQLVAQRLNLATSEILLCDDSEENIVAAKQQGWNAFLFRDINGFDELIKTLLMSRCAQIVYDCC